MKSLLKKLKTLCHVHRWKYVRKYFPDTFEGVEVESYYHAYRICKKCGKVQTSEIFCGFELSNWATLPEQKAEILKTLIIDAGDYYILKRR